MSSTSATLKMILLGEDRSASKTLRGVGKEADYSSTRIHHLSKAAGVALVGGFAAAGVAAVSFAKAAAEDDAGQRRLAQTLLNTTHANKQQIAGVEDWITAQGKALGVSDDELRPALGALATATGRVGKAQRLASLAMDVSAGTGKSLAAVTGALVKAQNGSVGGLARLGIATKDAAGHTKSFAQIQGELAKKFKGQAATAADTAQGKYKTMTVQFHELQETIGYHLIPVLTNLATAGLKAVDWISNNQKTVAIFVGTLAALTAGVWAVNGAVAVYTAAQTVATAVTTAATAASLGTRLGLVALAAQEFVMSAATKVWAASQWLLNAALTANPIGLVIVGIGALVAGFIYAYKHSEKFRAIVQGAFAGVKASAAAVASFFTSAVPAAFNKVKSAASTALGWIKGHWPLILGILTGPIGIAVALIATHWSQITSGARQMVGKVTGFFKSLPGKILGAVGNLGGLLLNAGKAVIQGLINGIQSKVGDVAGALHKITKMIPLHKGPIQKDRVLLYGAGQAIIDGLIGGMNSKRMKLKDALGKMSDLIKAAGDKLAADKDARNSFASGFSSFSSSVFGRDLGQDADGNAMPESVAGIINFQRQQEAQAKSLASNVKRLVSLGLSKDLIAQMQQAGSAGIAQISTLAASATRADIASLNASNKNTYAYDQQAGMAAGNAIYGSQISRDAAEVAHRREVERQLKRMADWGDTVTFVQRGDDLVATIRKTQRKKGQAVSV